MTVGVAVGAGHGTRPNSCPAKAGAARSTASTPPRRLVRLPRVPPGGSSPYFCAFMNVSILIVRPLLEAVAANGVPIDRLLSAASFDAARLDDVEGRLEVSELDHLQEVALALTGDPALGIHMGERASAPAYDIIGYLGTHASTLRECIETLLRYSRIVTDLSPILEESDDVATIILRHLGPPDSPPARLRAETALTGFVRLIRSFCGEGATPREVLFEYAAPPYRAEYTRVFGGLERFQQPLTGLRFDRAMLSQEAPIHKNPRLSALFTSEAERVLHRLERGVTHAERLRGLLAAQRVDAPPTMSDVARRLGMSVRSLRRRLAEEGVSYPKLLEEAHVAFAKRLLDDPDRSIYEAAFEMGFSDPSAFHRAFRRWTGMTPMQYRENIR